MADRGRGLYDWWGRHAGLYRVVESLSLPVRREAVDHLALTDGDTALDLGCGPGGSLGLLSTAVGPAGRVVAVDYSAEMTRRASARTRDDPVTEVVCADAGGLPLAPDSVDGALASLALSAMPRPRAVAAAVRDALAAEGRLVVVDGRVPDGMLERPLSAAYRRVANWQGTDVVAVLRDVFETVDVVATYDAGLSFVAVARP